MPASPNHQLPHDIYAGDRKLGGILIEGCISGQSLESVVLGVGINVNQTEFLSDAPNPVSMAQIAGHTFELEALAQTLADETVTQMEIYEEDPEYDELHYLYMQSLWHGE